MRTLESVVLKNNLHSVFGRVGSVWSSNTTEEYRKISKMMADSTQICDALVDAAGTPQLLSGTTQEREWLNLPLSDDNVWAVHGDLADQLEDLGGNVEGWVGIWSYPGYPSHPAWTTLFGGSENLVLTTEYGQLMLYPDGTQTSEVGLPGLDSLSAWVWATPPMLTVNRIQTADGRQLVRGVEFSSAPGVVLMWEDPQLLCPSGWTSVSATERLLCPLAYTLQLDGVLGPAPWVMAYYRNSGGLGSLYKAVAEASGLQVVNQAGAVLAVRERLVGRTYVLPEGEVLAWYPHTALEVGDTVEVGQVIGGESLTMSVAGSILSVVLEPTLFYPGSAYDLRAREFLTREKPLGLNLEIST